MKKLCMLSCMFFFCLSLRAFASDVQDKKEDEKWSFPYTKEFGIVSGYAHGSLKEKGSYKIIPVLVRFGFNLDSIGLGFCDFLRPVASKMNMKPRGFTEIILEPYVNTVVSPDSNIEAGCTILLKYSYPLTQKIYPYVLGGGGGIFLSQHTREESTQWGYAPQIGTGFSYFFKKDTALNVEYRYRHSSNADYKAPNEGINVNMFLVGVSWFY